MKIKYFLAVVGGITLAAALVYGLLFELATYKFFSSVSPSRDEWEKGIAATMINNARNSADGTSTTVLGGADYKAECANDIKNIENLGWKAREDRVVTDTETTITRTLAMDSSMLEITCSASWSETTSVELFIAPINSPLWSKTKEERQKIREENAVAQMLSNATLNGYSFYTTVTPPGGDYKTVCDSEIKSYAIAGWVVNPETIVDETSITRSMVKGDNILHANCSASQTGGSSTDVNLFVEQVGSPLWTTLKEKFLERAIVTGGFSYSVLTPPGGDYKTVCAGEIKVFADLGWTVGESRGIVDNKISMMSTMTKDSSILEVNCRAPEGGGDGTGVGLFVPKKS